MDRRDLLKKTALGMGITLTPPAISAILNSCSPSKAPLNWEPKALSEEQSRAVGAIADTLLPRTDTPGALDLLIDRFVDIMIANTYKDEDKETFTGELDAFMANSLKKYGSPIDECSDEEKIEIVRGLEETSNRYAEKVWGKDVEKGKPITFYRKLKSLVLFGYYSSEEVGKNILSYDPVPGQQIGCIPLSDVGNSWTEG